jgi:hypothetical protein
LHPSEESICRRHPATGPGAGNAISPKS